MGYLDPRDSEIRNFKLHFDWGAPVIRLFRSHGRQPEMCTHQVLTRAIELDTEEN